MILLIDNYDSFVYNLSRYFVELGCETEVARNDRITIEGVLERRPEAIVLSPGPGTPESAGICIPLIRAVGGRIPILGVCLGHQALGAAFGAHIIRGPEPFHGRTSLIEHDGTSLFTDLPQPLRVMRYHSLIVDPQTVSADWRVTARTTDGIIMAMEHTRYPMFGVQFHPESILTDGGYLILHHFLTLAGIKHFVPPACGHLELQPISEDKTATPPKFIPW